MVFQGKFQGHYTGRSLGVWEIPFKVPRKVWVACFSHWGVTSELLCFPYLLKLWKMVWFKLYNFQVKLSAAFQQNINFPLACVLNTIWVVFALPAVVLVYDLYLMEISRPWEWAGFGHPLKAGPGPKQGGGGKDNEEIAELPSLSESSAVPECSACFSGCSSVPLARGTHSLSESRWWELNVMVLL